MWYTSTYGMNVCAIESTAALEALNVGQAPFNPFNYIWWYIYMWCVWMYFAGKEQSGLAWLGSAFPFYYSEGRELAMIAKSDEGSKERSLQSCVPILAARHKFDSIIDGHALLKGIWCSPQCTEVSFCLSNFRIHPVRSNPCWNNLWT